MMGKIDDRRRRGRHRMRWLDGITDSMDMSFEYTPGFGDGQGRRACFSPWGPQTRTRLSDGNELHSIRREFSLVCFPE